MIGASGTPTIESPNNLNLNAVNVAISTNVSVGGTLTVSGNVSIGGTLTYEDVTNIDSVGIITARNGLIVTAGVSTFVGLTSFRDDVNFDDGAALTFDQTNGGFIYADGNNFIIQGTNANSGTYVRGGNKLYLSAAGNTGSHTATIELDKPGGNGRCKLFYGNNSKLETTSTGIDIDGSVNIINFSVSANSTSAYRFSGGGVVTTEDNPDIYLVRGHTYRFYNTTGSNHPFAIRSAVTNSGGTSYTDGVSGNQNNYQTFTVPLNAPSNLYYQCTIHTQNMQGNIYVRGGGAPETNVGITTFVEGISLNHASSSTNWNIENSSTNQLRFVRSDGTVDLQISSKGSLGLGGDYGSVGQVLHSEGSTGLGDKHPEWGSALFYNSLLREMTPTTNAISYNQIPSWVEKITILFHKVSLSGTNNIYVKLQNSGGVISSGYNSYSSNNQGNTSSSRNDSFVIMTNAGSHTFSGKMEIHKIDSTGLRWVSTHMGVKLDNNLRTGAGDLTIASGGAVTGYYIGASGTNTFDGDSRISIIFQ